MNAITKLMATVVDLANSLDIKNICELPGCWEVEIDEHWWIAVNGHKQEIRCSAGVDVKPFTCYVQYNGWPAGFFSAFDGLLAFSEAANEDTFILAIEKRIKEENGQKSKAKSV